MNKPRLLFVSPRFLFPIDSGGKIRTTGILREMKGGAFDITLVSPAPPAGDFDADMATVADRWEYWPTDGALARRLRRAASVLGRLPVPVASDASAAARRLIATRLADGVDLAVFDFAHAAVLAPDDIPVPSVMFTHNVEAEIFERHAAVAANPLMRWLWRSQWQKMAAFEKAGLARFDKVIAVSERDKAGFETAYGTRNVATIPTGVDLGFFPYDYTPEPSTLVFTGSMDWLANQDGIEFFMQDVWPLIRERVAAARMTVVGRAPPERLVQRGADFGDRWRFTGFVDDVRPYIHKSAVYVIPLRVGGGTRLKVFEAMASGCPVVSTAIGVEGLDLKDGEHYLNAETATDFAAATVRLLSDPDLARRLSVAARRYVEENASNAVVARRFEEICRSAMGGAATSEAHEILEA